jgi:hypothetical protein
LIRRFSSLWILYLIIREPLLVFKFTIVSGNMVRVEFDQWFQDLYRESVKVTYSGFQVHYPPLTAICITTLSVLFIAISNSGQRSKISWRFLSRLAEVELGIVIFPLLLGLYSHAPSRFNVLLACASLYSNADQIQRSYATLYAPSGLTVYFGISIHWITQCCGHGRTQLPLDSPRENLEPSVSAPVPASLGAEQGEEIKHQLDSRTPKGRKLMRSL